MDIMSKSEECLISIKRNKIAYDGFFVREDYVERKREQIEWLISKLVKTVGEKIG